MLPAPVKGKGEDLGARTSILTGHARLKLAFLLPLEMVIVPEDNGSVVKNSTAWSAADASGLRVRHNYKPSITHY